MTLFLYDGGTGGQFSKVTHTYKFNYKTYNFSTLNNSEHSHSFAKLLSLASSCKPKKIYPYSVEA